ncbi:membrane protein [Azospirillum argentinense]|uniref:DUF2243 domain-containing protein n=1 Tax=Azospirillum argentinense TaxID=2970906 RepID=A0A060DK96_9PROT|nr:DUF2243 domain-containing protein [Azospirillum argentinense]AIB11154.1 membrane protein [Azospirillum argentinense]EZQ08105.1 hypothetical protein ABAZ39_05220 [Azospirillum argentinense]PNQ95630.1 DUF2243 domain-containing protein [Azospirillum argentinense]
MSPDAVHPPSPARATAGFPWAGYLLGFALGGFFDGILLHQVLQWHHLLSAVESSAVQDIRVQILADGLFHAAMYVVAAVGLWLLWRSRRRFAEPGADRLLFANALIGFGVWHILDGVLSHWILGIHRIRMDSANPLLWDLLWFVVFGVAVAAAGWRLRRGGGGGSGGRAAPVILTPVVLTLVVLIAGPVAALPPPGVTTVMVLFKPDTTALDVFAAVAAVDGRTVWQDPSGQLWAIDLGEAGSPTALYRHGALLVSNTLLPTGCLDWFRT